MFTLDFQFEKKNVDIKTEYATIVLKFRYESTLSGERFYMNRRILETLYKNNEFKKMIREDLLKCVSEEYSNMVVAYEKIQDKGVSKFYPFRLVYEPRSFGVNILLEIPYEFSLEQIQEEIIKSLEDNIRFS